MKTVKHGPLNLFFCFLSLKKKESFDIKDKKHDRTPIEQRFPDSFYYCGDGKWTGRGWCEWRMIEGLDLNLGPLSFSSVCWLSSSEQIEVNRISCSYLHSNMEAEPGLTVIRRLHFMSSASARRILMKPEKRLAQKQKSHYVFVNMRMSALTANRNLDWDIFQELAQASVIIYRCSMVPDNVPVAEAETPSHMFHWIYCHLVKWIKIKHFKINLLIKNMKTRKTKKKSSKASARLCLSHPLIYSFSDPRG